MNARQRCRNRRQMRYRQQCKKDDEIRLLRLSILRGYEKMTRSTEDIMDSIGRKTLDQKRDNIDRLADFLYTFKKELNITNSKEEASFTNRCLPKTYLYAVKRRGR
ncbi:hypothetical protein BJP41_05025 [Candidatus Williamhamiltonella defendens]|uniref:Uncharacterized protein n=1 Tax=Candidatus Williamhamiltonella defendens TaxID=138072 RepID=A0A2D3T7I8_9ENTR|nr:hypothetical protein [Candidatus Hamiltonella defensa]ATW29801.1 hypothetical protein BJP41_05025 [Candidatus Hamiltonella defensa]ATW31775.1 hypothetical protein BJP42_05105 [Candidatus Hamiltonella defensa]